MKRLLPFFVLLLFVSSTLCAQQNDCRRRVVPVSVVDREGVPVAGLTTENFRGEFRGTPLRIASVKPTSSPSRIVFLFEMSRSGRSAMRFRPTATLLSQLFASLPEGTQIALVTFANKAELRSKRFQSVPDALDFLKDMINVNRDSLRDEARLYDAIAESAHLLDPARAGDIVYVLTDGTDTGSRQSAASVEQALMASGIRLFVSLFERGDESSTSLIRLPGAAKLDLLSKNTGGQKFIFPLKHGDSGLSWYDLSKEGMQKIHEMASTISSVISQSYVVELELSQGVDKPEPWKFEAVLASGPMKHVNVRYPVRLFPCSAATTPQPLPN